MLQLVLSEELLKDLSVIRDLGSDQLGSIVKKISDIDPPPLKTETLRLAVKEVLEEQDIDIDAVIQVLLSLQNLRRQRGFDYDTLLKVLNEGLADLPLSMQWNKDEISSWKDIEPTLIQLLSLSNITNVLKSLELAYDYTNLFRRAKIITDIRPVFSEDALKIQGAIISYSLRLSYSTGASNKVITIALDEQDVQKLSEGCNRAIEKAKTAKAFLCDQQSLRNILIAGEKE